MIRILALLLALLTPALTAAEESGGVVQAELRPGWRLPDGDHMAALHLRLAPGWKTYWRAPGDAGIPPLFDWSGAQNVAGVAALWPSPHVFRQSGMRSVGYAEELVLPLRVRLSDTAVEARLGGIIDIGVCRDICVPQRLRVTMVLPAGGKPDPRIAAALADQPLSAAAAGVTGVRCTVSPGEKGLILRAEIDLPGGAAETVIETADPRVWVAEPRTARDGGRLVAETKLRHVDGGVFALDRSGIRITVLEPGRSIDIRGCEG